MNRIVYAALLFCTPLFAQSPSGYVTGSVESNSIAYVDDLAAGSTAPEGIFGSNNYAKVDAVFGGFSAGFQFESYMPALQGYPAMLQGSGLGSKYISYVSDSWNVRVGDFYEQFGSGLLFRTWEDRALGLNNSLEGVDVSFILGGIAGLKAVYGRPRYGLDYVDTWVRGADLYLSLGSLIPLQGLDFGLSGSCIQRYEPMVGSTSGYSLRTNAAYKGLSVDAEYVRRDDSATALLVQGTYSGSGLGVTASFRKMENMTFISSSSHNDAIYGSLNYVPALTQQYTYALTAINPYNAHPGSELGGQIDLYYSLRRGSLLGGARGMKLHANYSQWHGPQNPYMLSGTTVLYFRDFSADIEKYLTRQLKLKALYSFQAYNPCVKDPTLAGMDMWNSHIVVLDLLYKYTRQNSLRMELQHLFASSHDEDGLEEEEKYRSNWLAALLECNIGTAWSLYVQDSWNYGNMYNPLHYYNGGVSYSRSSMRVDLTFGRYMQGFLCSGGVCRTIPAYTGANLKFQFLF